MKAENSCDICEDALNFQKVYENVQMSPMFQDVQIDVLFENFDQRIDFAKNITASLCSLETQIQTDSKIMKSNLQNSGKIFWVKI